MHQAIAQQIQKQRACQPVFQAARWVGACTALVVGLNAGHGRAEPWRVQGCGYQHE